jgi:acyl-homoserine-lactone acylase
MAMRWGWIAASLVALAVGGAFAAGLRLTPLELKRFDRAAAIATAKGYDSLIRRDQWGIPRVWGKRDADAAFALAYAHAEDDFATIQESLRLSRGADMLARNKGEAQTAFVFQWTGAREIAEAKYETLDAPTRALIEGYVAGLNYYAALHPDKAAKDLFPARGQDVIAMTQFYVPMFYGMSGVLGDLFSPGAKRDPNRGQVLQVGFNDYPRTGVLADARQAGLGSNAFAVAAPKSADGSTWVIVNSHQPLEGPLAWYEAAMTSDEGLNFAGGAFPGSPTLHLGVNDDLAVAATVNSPDLIDVYKLTLADGGKAYVLDGKPVAFETRTARMLVQVWGPFAWQVTRPIKISRHGPVVENANGAFAVRWASMESIGYPVQSYRMMRARSLAEFTAVAQMNEHPSQNRIVGDRNGAIARFYNARMPKRVDGPDWSGVVPGDRSDLIWTEFEDYMRLPHLIQPKAGYVFDSNGSPFRVTGGADDPKADNAPKAWGIKDELTNRGLRAFDLLRESGALSREQLLRIRADRQYHTESMAAKLKAAIVAKDWPADLADAKALIAAWDLRADVDNRAAALALLTMQPIGIAMHTGQAPPSIDETFPAAAAFLRKNYGRIDPTWGEVHRLERAGKSLPIGGGPDTLRAASFAMDPAKKTLPVVNGDGLIMISEWKKDGTHTVWAVSPFGASMDPASKHHTDQMDMYAAERFREVPMTKAAIEAATVQSYKPGTVQSSSK